MQQEATKNDVGLFDALKSVSDRLRTLAEVMNTMNGFEPGAKITLSQQQVDILFTKVPVH
ncbi:MAG: hypothetical protein HUJ29_05340 [Gammaproteobacteria bacterium]|nr:hypothetical protein [Gammaproteobacteria bacterium]